MKNLKIKRLKGANLWSANSTQLLWSIFFLMLVLPQAKAQNGTGVIKGKVFTKEDQPIAFANVTLLNASDSKVIQAVLSDFDGSYIFTKADAGEYKINVEAVGYNTRIKPPFIYKLITITLDPIIMEESLQVLQEVVINSSKSPITRKDDRMIVNVAGTVLAAGNNAIDILERTPGVLVDKDGTISLNGKAGVTVMINEKLTYLSNSQLAALLRSTSGDTIESVEIMTNPSSRYDAAGSSGIINIKLKRNKKDGFNGSLSAGVGQARFLSDNAVLSLNAKSEKLNVFASFSRNNDKRFFDLSSERQIDSSGFGTHYIQKSRLKDVALNNSFRAGADYETGKNNTTGIVVNGYFNDNTITNNGMAFIKEQFQNKSSNQISISDDRRKFNNIGINVNNRIKLDTLGQSLSVDFDYIKYNNKGRAFLSSLSTDPDTGERASYYLKQYTPAEISVSAAKADYVFTPRKTIKLEAGIKISQVKTDNTIEAQTSSDNIKYDFNTQLSNQFIYKEKIQAGYLNFSKTLEKTTIQLGLRSEYTSSEGTLLNSGSEPISRSYFDLFPNLFVMQSLKDKNSITFNYSRRIQRPNYQSLNPFAYFIDPYTRSLGNPFLKPQYADNFELNYTYRKLNIGAAYSRTANVNTETVVIDTLSKISSVTYINLKALDRYTFTANYSFNATPWWSGNLNTYLIYNNYNLEGTASVASTNKNLSYNIKTSQYFNIGKNSKFEINARYQSRSVYGLYHLKDFSTVDTGFSHSFWSEKANLKISVNDIFNGRKTDLIIENKGSTVHGYQKIDTRVLKVVLTYNFGSSKLKTTSRQGGANDEKSRAGS